MSSNFFCVMTFHKSASLGSDHIKVMPIRDKHMEHPILYVLSGRCKNGLKIRRRKFVTKDDGVPCCAPSSCPIMEAELPEEFQILSARGCK